jgi:hypothetical protein
MPLYALTSGQSSSGGSNNISYLWYLLNLYNIKSNDFSYKVKFIHGGSAF